MKPEEPSKPSVMPEPVVTSPESDFDFTDTPQEDIPQTAQDARRRASEFFEDEQQRISLGEQVKDLQNLD